MTEAKHTPGPWYVRDFRAIEMARLGWTGPSIDRILITNKTGPEIEACAGADSVIARIQFDNRPEALTDGNLADARLIAAAPDMLAVAKLPLVHQIEESEGLIRLSIAGVEVCAHPDGTPQATALLQFDAQQRAALSKAGLPQGEKL